MLAIQRQIEDVRPYLLGCGYTAANVVEDVRTASGYIIPVAAFAHAQHDSRSACLAFIRGAALDQGVAACGTMGAPLAFAFKGDGWELWAQEAQGPRFIEHIHAKNLASFFQTKHDDLAPKAIYRAKTWARFDCSYQLSFVDMGLLPLVEKVSGRMLSDLIERTVDGIKSRLQWKRVSQEQGHWLLKASFWLLAAKILKDKAVPTFAEVDLEDLPLVFRRVASHYGSFSRVDLSSQDQKEALLDAAKKISVFSDTGMVSTEALSYLYENTLISKVTRSELGTHSTPPYLVDYVLGRLRPWIEEIPFSERRVFEPACGHAAFLLAAMRQLGDMAPESMSTFLRHQYLRDRLYGCDVDSFALEIARLRLTLADVPNPNGWDLRIADVFNGDLVEQQAARATIVLANPPFEDRSSEALRQAGPGQQVNKAAELLRRVITASKPGSVFGFVLPRGFLHSKGAEPVRRSLTADFELSEILLLPDRVFGFSDSESTVLLGRRIRGGQQERTPVHYRRVRERDLDNFRQSYHVSEEKHVEYTALAAPGYSFLIPELEDVWGFCKDLPHFETFANIGQGFSFRSHDDPAFPPGSVTESPVPTDGFISGFARLRESLQTHQLPDEVWLNLSASVIGVRRSGLVNGVPQVLLNYARVSRGPWRLKAFLDRQGRPTTGAFLSIRPKRGGYPLEAVWGICNSPLANGYAYVFSSTRHVLAGRIRSMPVPDINSVNVDALDQFAAIAEDLGEEADDVA